MDEQVFILETEFIPLTGLLKSTGIAATGGHASMIILDGEVSVNGEVAHEKRKKIRVGDRIEVMDQIIIIK